MPTRLAKYFGSLAVVAALALPAHADPVADFYKSHTVTMLVGYTTGGGFDLYARSVAAHIGKYIPGHPTVIVQNMSGAGSLKAANYIYNVAPKDGTVFGLVRAPVMEPIIGSHGAAFDATKFTWIGSGTSDLTICGFIGNPKIKTLTDAEKYPATVAGSGPGSDEDMFTKILDNLFGLKLQLVSGYPGGAEMLLAVERGEVDGRCGWSYSSIKITKPDWIAQKKLKVLAVLALERAPELPDAPAIMEFAKTERQKKILRLVLNCQIMGRPFAAPPNVPADRAAALRKAFEDTMKAPVFMAEMKTRKMEVSPLDWQKIDALMKELYATPKDIGDETKAIIAGK
jgi:tripartite-type tricarboxylate transporter receptor subunit TctC